jgi:hypothetical protein
MAINGGRGSSGPGYMTGGQIKTLIGLPQEFLRRATLISGVRRPARQGIRPSSRVAFESDAINYDQMQGRSGRNAFWQNEFFAKGRPGPNEVVGHIYSNAFYRRFGQPQGGSSPRLLGSEITSRTGVRISSRSGYAGPYDVLPNNMMTIPEDFNTALSLSGANKAMWLSSQRRPEHMLSLLHFLTSQGIGRRQALTIAQNVLNRINSNIERFPDNARITERMFGNIVTNSTRQEMMRLKGIGELNERQNSMNPLPRGSYTPGAYWGYNRNRRNSGGIIRGYNRGGKVPGYSRGGGMATPGRMFYGENQPPYLSAAYMAGKVPLPAAPIIASVPRATVMDRLRLAGYLPGSNVSPLNIDPETRNIIPGPPPRQMSMGKSMGLGMLGSMAGTAAGSPLGPIGQMIGGTAGFMLPQLISQLGRGASLAANLGKLLKAFTIPGLVITGISLAVKGLLNWKKAAEEAGKANRLAFGGTEDSFASVGINNFKAMTDRIKEINEALELHKAKVKSTFESYTQTGTPGLTLTIKELKEAIEEAKTSQKDYVNAFNNIDSSRVVDYAAQIKAQFVAMGMSAQEATNQIYAIIRASEKAGQALSAITSKDFISISDTVSGINMLVKGLKKELESEDFNAEEFNTGLDTLLNSLTIYKDSLVGTKDDNQQLIDQADALAITMEKVTASAGSRKELSAKNLEALKDENILYSAILGSVETIESISAKIMIYQSGFAEVVNLAAMGAAEAAAFARNLAIVQNAMNEVTEDTSSGAKNPLLPLANIIAAVKKDAQTAADQIKTLKKVDEDYYKNKIESIQKVIKALEKEREARLKALDVQEEAQSYEIQLSQAQIRYKQAIATGDLALAAQEQLSIEQLVSDRQRQLTRDQINNSYDAKIEKLEARIEKLQEQLENAKDSYNSKTAAATQKAADLASLENYRDRLEAIALKNIGKAVMSKTDAQEISNIFQEMTEAGGEVAKAASDMRRTYGVGASVYQMGWQQSLVNALNQQVGGNADFKNAVDAFAAAVAKFKGESTPVDSSKINVETKTTGKAAIVIRTIPVSELKKKGIKLKAGTEFTDDDSNRYSIEKISGKTATIKKRQSGGMFGPLDTMLVGERGPEIVKFNRSGNVYPNPGTASWGVPAMEKNSLNPYFKEIASALKTDFEKISQDYYLKSLQNATIQSGGSNNTQITLHNTYNIPQGLSKQEVGQYIVDLQKKELSKLGITRSF